MAFLGNKKKDMSDVKFREFAWGESRKVVENAEDGEPAETNIKGEVEQIGYSDTLKNHQFLVNYNFVNDKLAKGRYICVEEHLSEYEYVSIFDDLLDLLKDKYGKPTQMNTVPNADQIWRNEGYGQALWEGEEVSVSLQLMMQQSQLVLEIIYDHNDLTQELINAIEEQTSGKL